MTVRYHIRQVHILHGEFLEAQRRGDEARLAFCSSPLLPSPLSLFSSPPLSHHHLLLLCFFSQARLAFCASYRAAGPPRQFVDAFMPLGVAALQAEGGADLGAAEGYFAMAACIDPSHAEVGEALKVVRDAMAIRAAG